MEFRYQQFILDIDSSKKLDEIIRRSGKTKQDFLADAIKDIIKKNES